MRGVSGAAPITRFDASDHSTRFACELKGFDPLNYVDRKAAKRMDVYGHYAVAASNEALAHAGIDTTTLTDAQRARIGVIIGSGQGGMETFQQQAVAWHTGGPGRLSPFFVPMIICDIGGAWVAMQHGLRGPNHAVVSACATGNDCIMSALDSIRAGRADIMLAGGAECAITPLGVGGFGAARALSSRNDDPEKASRPFDQARDGFVIGEGAGVLVMEALESAEARGATIYAEVLAVGAACDAHHLTAPHPDGLGARLAMEGAFAESRLSPTDVDSINMHATSTGLGDVAECSAVRAVFGDHADVLTATATKSMTGHMLGAAGAVEALFSIQSLLSGIVPPAINIEAMDPACVVNVAANAPVHRTVNVVLSNAFGFGGHNTAALFATRAVGDAI